MQVVTTTTHLGVIQAANPEDATLPPKLQSHLAHLPRYASPTTKALSLSHQSLVYYLTGVLNASIGFQTLHLTHPTTALQPATRAITKAWAAHWGWPTSIPTRAIRAAGPHYADAIENEVKVASPETSPRTCSSSPTPQANQPSRPSPRGPPCS